MIIIWIFLMYDYHLNIFMADNLLIPGASWPIYISWQNYLLLNSNRNWHVLLEFCWFFLPLLNYLFVAFGQLFIVQIMTTMIWLLTIQPQKCVTTKVHYWTVVFHLRKWQFKGFALGRLIVLLALSPHLGKISHMTPPLLVKYPTWLPPFW